MIQLGRSLTRSLGLPIRSVESYEYKSLLLQHECFKMEEADVELPKTIPARRSWAPEKE